VPPPTKAAPLLNGQLDSLDMCSLRSLVDVVDAIDVLHQTTGGITVEILLSLVHHRFCL
jgi:hypothetical protein